MANQRLNRSQLVWRCRRGVRELDVLLTRFLETEHAHLNDQEHFAFERLLEVQDPIIMDWLFGKSTPEDAGVLNIINKLKVLSGL